MPLQIREILEAMTRIDQNMKIAFHFVSASENLEEFLTVDNRPVGKSLSAYSEQSFEKPEATIRDLCKDIIDPLSNNYPNPCLAALRVMKDDAKALTSDQVSDSTLRHLDNVETVIAQDLKKSEFNQNAKGGSSSEVSQESIVKAFIDFKL